MSRNVINVHDIDNFVFQLMETTRYEKVRMWLKTVLRKWIIKNYDIDYNTYEWKNNSLIKKSSSDVLLENMTEESFCSFFPEWAYQAVKRETLIELILNNGFFHEVANIVDYLNSLSNDSIFNRLNRIDFDEARRQSNIWHRKISSYNAENVDVGEALLLDVFDNGYRMVELTSQQLLIREGSIMRHCIGGYSLHNDTNYLSLWDEKNQPHVTMEILNNEVQQISGKGNDRPAEKYMVFVRKFLSDWGIGYNFTGFSRVRDNIRIHAGGQTYNVPSFEDFVNVVSYESLKEIAFAKHQTTVRYFMEEIDPHVPGFNRFMQKLKAVAKPHRVMYTQINNYGGIPLKEIDMPLGYFNILGEFYHKDYKNAILDYAALVLSEIADVSSLWFYKTGDAHSSLKNNYYKNNHYNTISKLETKHNPFGVRNLTLGVEYKNHTGKHYKVNPLLSNRPLYDLLNFAFGKIGAFRDSKWKKIREMKKHKSDLKEINQVYSSGEVF